MAKIGTQIYYISGRGPQQQHFADGRGINPVIKQRMYIAGDTEDKDYAQQLLNDTVEADQLSFYQLNISKTQLTGLINDYTYNSNPQGWTVADANEANQTINEINTELNKLGARQNTIANTNGINVETGLDPQFSEFVGINGIKRIGIIPVVVIVVAIIAVAIVAYQLIQLLEDLSFDGQGTVERTKILTDAANKLTPDDEIDFWIELQRQADKNYQSGNATGNNDNSLLGDLSNVLMWGVIGFVAFKGINMLQQSQTTRRATPSVSGIRRSPRKKKRTCNICALKRRMAAA